MSATDPKRDEVIRFRAEGELKKRINRVARYKKKKPAEFLRDALWALVESEEKSLATK